METMEKKVTFKNFRGLDIIGIVSRHEEPRPAVIVSHGFLSFKENKLIHSISERLAENGFVSLKFDFSGCVGESGGTCSDIMLSHEVDDLLSAVSFLQEQDYVDGRIGLAGHSLGGLTSLIVASRDDRIGALAPVAAPAKLAWQTLISDEMAEMWEHDRKYVFKSVKGDVEIDFSFYKDMKEYDGEKIAQSVKIPTRVVHGSADKIVPMKNAEAIFGALAGNKDMQVIEGGDHMLLKGPYMQKTSGLVTEWMKANL